MGYSTEFIGKVIVDPPLSAKEVEYLTEFANTRRMARKKGPYFVKGTGYLGQNTDADVLDDNNPPPGQPSLWCHWVPTEDGTGIEWSGSEKFYEAEKWMQYLIDHFIGESPAAKLRFPEEFAFLQGHTVYGLIEAHGEEPGDIWAIEVENNQVYVLSVTMQAGSRTPTTRDRTAVAREPARIAKDPDLKRIGSRSA